MATVLESLFLSQTSGLFSPQKHDGFFYHLFTYLYHVLFFVPRVAFRSTRVSFAGLILRQECVKSVDVQFIGQMTAKVLA